VCNEPTLLYTPSLGACVACARVCAFRPAQLPPPPGTLSVSLFVFSVAFVKGSQIYSISVRRFDLAIVPPGEDGPGEPQGAASCASSLMPLRTGTGPAMAFNYLGCSCKSWKYKSGDYNDDNRQPCKVRLP